MGHAPQRASKLSRDILKQPVHLLIELAQALSSQRLSCFNFLQAQEEGIAMAMPFIACTSSHLNRCV